MSLQKGLIQLQQFKSDLLSVTMQTETKNEITKNFQFRGKKNEDAIQKLEREQMYKKCCDSDKMKQYF